MKRWKTPQEAAEYLPFCERVIRRKLRKGELPGMKFGKFWLVDMKEVDFDINEEIESGN